MCRNPYVVGMAAYGCGQCLPCRVNRRRMWTHRIILEALCHEVNSFVTLTYDDQFMEVVDGRGTVRSKHFQDWVKRLRKGIFPGKVRYFGVGEYGGQTHRPHYHVALFGYGGCVHGVTSFGRVSGSCCVNCDLVKRTWGKGNILLGSLTAESAGYIAGYTLKKMTGKDDVRLEGREPEFARMSSVPGIGRNALFDVADVLMRHGLDDLVDVPGELRHGRRIMPLGRYMRRKLRASLGQAEEAPEATVAEAAAKLQPLYENARAVAASAPSYVRSEILKAQFKDNIVNAFEGRYQNLLGREKRKKRIVL